MATKAADRPALGTQPDPQPKKITTDIALNEVSPDSPAAAFSWLPADLERVRERREELGLNDDKARVQAESQKAELATAKRRLAATQAQVDALEAQVAEAAPKGKAKDTE